ncbi:MAG: Type-1 restriction enzyme MjaXIP specificity protein [Methanosaeta sp. PtaU1.Bin112]|nr:MAG: Type-1 restriction enzyme MjaXIP specificity protein [Methanosaeta sp. PtaU1.Bin112]
MNCIRLSDSHERVTLLGAENGTRYAPKGSILILVRGSMLHQRIPIGITTKDVTFNQDVKAIVPALDVLPEFLLYWLLSNESKLLEMVEFTGIGAGKLSTDLLYNMKVKLPSLPEQRAIAHILSTLDDKIELNRRMNETLEAIARALFKSWFVDFDPVRDKAEGREPAGMDAETAALFPDSFEETELGEVPKGWSVTGIYDVAEVIYGAPFSSKRFNDKGNGLPLLRIRDLATQEPQIFTTENHPRGTKVKQGDVIVGMDGEFKVHLWSGPISWLNQRVCMFVPKEGVPSFFVMLSLEEPLAFFERSKVGTTVIHLGKSDIDSFKIIIPNREVLRVFSVLVDPICKKIILNSNESRILATIRDALLLKLLNGDLHAGIKYIIRRTL